MSMVTEINGIKMLSVSPALTPRDFEEFATRFPAPIPSSFRTFYLTCNGGFPSEEETERGNWGLPVGGFNPIKHGDVTIETLIDDIGCLVSDSCHFPKHQYIPFAFDDGGHTIFLSLTRESIGKVFLFDEDEGHLVKFSDSFDALFRSLLPASEDSLSHREQDPR
ncbi:hypothetical protein VIBNISFn27_p10044 [Vibrio nigripulchritudo SFn27]|uniref:Cell wall assembly and cell proliferation coordinating protein, KNR4-like n=1 Tax=Vibrio nigripulchritudo TaxID=28173 RepID=A0A9P1JL74_9VIBR|nr:SMI1/KNR4 family protein [Vibrio nigripulchritudo]CBJ93088.1 putative Cell wall assembly and cell proliferation coordinating protein, KNR4-like [Vibrio nigripulchritudo]CCN38634.1 hypothetical protein VIBNIAM115_p0036 [Vibrio nigripulchritudo AM115]CCN44943.1 hypothetical protein VIBNIFTn2_p0035 [Vibrio nigripulchritudo FTn2]CCN79698.1 hypothetical protein VIBNISO65_p0035 [Vibrio nigripulchritudo SO65]CCN85903.1 hypothetical protein VIBNIBLFn1_p0040 [Vibrio nigripulchritudo BLFn1]